MYRPRASAVIAAGALSLATLAVAAPPASAAGPGNIRNIDGSGDSVVVVDKKDGPDTRRTVRAGSWDPAGFDVDVVIASCKRGTIRVRVHGAPDWNMGHQWNLLNSTTYGEVYVRGC